MSAVDRQLVDGAYVITLNRPEKLNALTSEMYSDLLEAVLAAAEEQAAEAIVLRAEGRGFCAGGDLDDFVAMTEVEDSRRYAAYVRAYQLHYPFEPMMTSPKPVICAVNGVAAGGGLALALASDLVVAGESASFGATEGRIGMYDNYVVELLKHRTGPGRTLYMALTTKLIPAVTAERWGLVHEVVADEALDSRALELAREVAAVPPKVRAAYKQMIQGPLPLIHDARPTVSALESEEARDGISAFIAGRRKG